MLITRETDYALRSLRALRDGKKKSLPTICEQEHVPKQFGYKILKKLSLADLVEIKRGKDGGYILKANLEELTIYDIVKLMDSGTPISACAGGGYDCDYRNAHNGMCNFHSAMNKIQTNLDVMLKSVTLAELVS